MREELDCLIKKLDMGLGLFGSAQRMEVNTDEGLGHSRPGSFSDLVQLCNKGKGILGIDVDVTADGGPLPNSLFGWYNFF
jgi:hypothetical protein